MTGNNYLNHLLVLLGPITYLLDVISRFNVPTWAGKHEELLVGRISGTGFS